MKKMDEIRHEVATCPRCMATCMVGSDEDGQIFCANCSNSFRPNITKEVTDEELRTTYSTTHVRKVKGGWVAFVKK